MARRAAGQAAPKRTLTAAATRLKLGDRKAVAAQVPRVAQWQHDAWTYYDEVPEVGQAVRFHGNAISKLHLFVGVLDPDDADGVPLPVDHEDVPAEVSGDVVVIAKRELRSLRGALGGTGALLKALDMNLEVAGECYLIGWAPRAGDDSAEEVIGPDGDPMVAGPMSWEIRSVDEVVVKDAHVFVKVDEKSTEGRKVDETQGDAAIRMWTPHPRRGVLPDCPMRQVLVDCEALAVLSAQVVAEANSRRAAGLLLVPNGLQAPAYDDEDGDDGDADEKPDPLLAQIEDAIGRAIADPQDGATVVPTMIRGERDDLKEVRHVTLGRESDQRLDARIEARVRRIARGLSVPVEVVEGMMGTTFANAEQIDADVFEDYLQPRCVLISDLLTEAWFRPNLVAAGVAPDVAARLVVWYDAEALIRQPDTEAAADEGLRNGSLSWAAWRAARGFDEGDAPEAEELLARIGLLRGIFTADLTKALVEFIGVPIEVEESAVAPGSDGDAGATSPPAEEVAAVLHGLMSAARQPRLVALPSVTAAGRRRPVGERMAALDAKLRDRLIVAASGAMDRAMERAGNRIRNQARGTVRESVAAVAPHLVAAQLGPAMVRQVLKADAVEDLLDESWAPLEDQFRQWAADAQDQALDLASEVVSNLDVARRRDLKLRQAADLDEAWAWLRQGMTNLAAQRLFDPVGVGDPLGEFDAMARVPAGMLREAIARAGGAAGLQTTQAGGVWVTLADGGARPAGGIATGELIRDVLRDGGAQIDAWEWEYGVASRATFEPHARLDGLVFETFDDPRLANTSGWPPVGFYLPGDHTGCLCDVIPVVVPAAEARAS